MEHCGVPPTIQSYHSCITFKSISFPVAPLVAGIMFCGYLLSHWCSFWAVLSIVAISNCDNDSVVWFNYGDNSLELINVPIIGEAVSPVTDLMPFPVDPSLDPNTILQDSLPPPCPPFPTFADAEFLDDQEFPASLGILDPASPIDTLDMTNWLSEVGDPYNVSETDILSSSLSLLPPLQHYEYAAGIDNVDSAPVSEEDTAPQATDGQDCVPEIPLIRQESKNVVPPDRDVEEEPSNSRPNEELDSWLRDQLRDISVNSILYNRSHDPVQIQNNSQSRTPLWTPDGERSQDDSRAWLTVGGTAFVAALLAELERRRKRVSSNDVDEEAPPNKKPCRTIVSQEDATESPQDITRCPSPYAGSVDCFNGSEFSQDFHHLWVTECLSKLGDADIIRERLDLHADEKSALEKVKEHRARVGMKIEEAYQIWLDGCERETALNKELKEAEDEAENLRMKCFADRLVDEEGLPINFEKQEHQDELSDEEDTRSQKSDELPNPAADSSIRFNNRGNTHEWQLWQEPKHCFNDPYDDEDSISLHGARFTGASMLINKPEVKKHNHTSGALYETPWIPSPEKRFRDCNILLPSEREPIRNAKHQDLPFSSFNEFTDDILRRIAEFLSYEDVVQLSLTCHKLRSAYKPILAETLRVSLVSYAQSTS
ncbi:hypothetical protein NA56DRAFT_13656 [Hyaloscypha hepaticicola]|uniref:F-box domain-containing protein n=1 Tax=Hyaloscypha hepaticicola TaxID=2082293 RepID=A0A2J6QQ81_9HELO|nr:hypothetical protein NA56DRAFT_13656 [Hyaloscypha hepaticicola]